MKKKILITGNSSYVGTKFKEWLYQRLNSYEIEEISVRGESWKETDFSKYDVLLHVAGIAHIKETKENTELYYKINRDLTYEIAQKAKSEGINQFVFLSSMSVYGISQGVIHKNTPVLPKSAYGKSKIEAEQLISQLADDSFTVAIIRPPMIYGKACRGNYPKLAYLAIKMPVFPNVVNKRSMIFIDNLSEFLKLIIDNKSSGIYYPQNTEYVNTSEMVNLIAKAHGKKIRMTKLLNPLLNLMNVSIFNKVFGNLVYDKSLSRYEADYNIYKFEESIERTEMGIVK